MKKSKIIAPALGVLILSTAASISGTVAWFSANNTVSVSGMALTAKSDSTFLVISNTSTLDSDVELVRNISGELIPSSFTTSAIVEETETVVAANSWYTAVGTATDDGTAKAGSYHQLTLAEANNFATEDGKDYYAFDQFYIGLATGSSAVETGKGIQADVTFNAAQSSNLNKCLTVKVVYGGGNPSTAATTQTYVYGAATGSTVRHASALQADSLITTTATLVKVYAYFDGEDANCKTENAINLDAISISINFTVNETLHS